MTTKVLCIDVSGSAIKAVLLEKGFRQSSIIDHLEAPLASGATIEETARDIQDLILTSNLEYDTLVLGLNSKKALLQNMAFPFADTSKINDVLPFELENVLPTRVSDYSLDFVHTEEAKASEARVLAALYPRDLLEQWVRALGELGLSPARVDLDMAALFSLGRQLSGQSSRNTLYLDLGWDRANLVWLHGPALHGLRTLPLGIKHLGLELSEAGNGPVDPDQARELFWSECGRVGDLISFYELTQQIQLTIISSDAPEPPEDIVLLGEGASDTMAAVFREKMDIPAAVLESLPGQPPDPTMQVTSMAIPYSMARFSSLRREAMNLLRGDLAPAQAADAWKPHLRFGIVAAAAIILTWALSFGTDLVLEKKRLSRLENALTQSFEDIVGQAPSNIRPVQYPSVIRSRIRALSSGSFSGDVPPLKGVELLWLISTSLPDNLELQNDLFALDGNVVRINGQAGDFKTVDSIKNSLAEVDEFSEVEIIGANVNQDGQGVSFSLRLTLAQGQEV